MLCCVAVLLAVLVGCAVGPDYREPATKVPTTWDGQDAVTPAQPSKTTDQPVQLVEWWQAFQDPALTSLVEMAIRANLDVRTGRGAHPPGPGGPGGGGRAALARAECLGDLSTEPKLQRQP